MGYEMGGFGMHGFGMGAFSIFQIMFYLVFFIVIGTLIVRIVRGASTWHKNNQAPVLTVNAKVIAKPTNVSVHHHNHGSNQGMHTSSSTSYYVTFEVKSGDRMEFMVSGQEFGLLVEGDYGELTFQGSRYKSFERVK